MKVLDEWGYAGDKYRLIQKDGSLDLLYNGDIDGQWFKADEPEVDRAALMYRLERIKMEIDRLAKF